MNWKELVVEALEEYAANGRFAAKVESISKLQKERILETAEQAEVIAAELENGAINLVVWDGNDS